MKKNSNRGFTLIELLVVIAIIGILAGVVLASLGTARAKAADAKIQGQLGGMQAQAELYSGAGDSFTKGDCAVDAGTLFDSANSGLGGLLAGLKLEDTSCESEEGLPSTGSAWAVAAKTSTGSWCVDSVGIRKASTEEDPADAITDAACN